VRGISMPSLLVDRYELNGQAPIAPGPARRADRWGRYLAGGATETPLAPVRSMA